MYLISPSRHTFLHLYLLLLLSHHIMGYFFFISISYLFFFPLFLFLFSVSYWSGRMWVFFFRIGMVWFLLLIFFFFVNVFFIPIPYLNRLLQTRYLSASTFTPETHCGCNLAIHPPALGNPLPLPETKNSKYTTHKSGNIYTPHPPLLSTAKQDIYVYTLDSCQ